MLSDKKGITLIELLMTIAIMSILMGAIITVVQYALSTNKEVMERNQLQHEALFIMEHMSNKMRQGATWEEAENQLVFKEDGEVNEVLIWHDATGERILFGESGSYVASDHVVHFQVTVNGTSLEVEIGLAHPGSNEQYDLKALIHERDLYVVYD